MREEQRKQPTTRTEDVIMIEACISKNKQQKPHYQSSVLQIRDMRPSRHFLLLKSTYISLKILEIIRSLQPNIRT